MTIKIHAQRYYQHLTPFHLFFVQEFFPLLDSLEVDSFLRRIVEEFDGLGDRLNTLLAWYFVSALRFIALQCTVLSVPFREIVRRFGPVRSVP